ncbi:hypothetical protein [Cellulosilyticum lentocellum]|uniref:N4-gp56 family major capsid protein n=1 Tax=Cellulosilyticum lentocellum (strain ATCC 49066 / DSM 5427 / NCIMB 11756 / RHM5) TaxID=642492 RepID=F2JQ57_CELLD|nr:hypothetical protein [Cellulosilyticum lentocellum]ADZ82605.1 hypothetical protein Clole_0872 [Cellulosilyticum lentocellum DSM 5427]
MSVDYATKYAKEVDERFKAMSRSSECVNDDYDFTGSKTVKVYTVNTASMNDYNRAKVDGTSRYGNVENLSATTQELTMSKDRSFTFAIDKADLDETQLALEAGKALDRQLREVVKPEVDLYRFTKMCANAGTVATAEEITAANVYTLITTGTEVLDDKEVPEDNRFIIVTPETYKFMKLNDDLVLDTNVGQEMRLKGVVAYVDGMKVIKVPSNRLPLNSGFLIGHTIATTAPIKLAEYKIHENPPGISGYLVEGRIYYDAFVLDNKKNALYLQPIAAQ